MSTSRRENPYPGLAPFGEQDASRFFGRDREIEEILDRLRTRRLLAVIGVSGCGKSSLVKAGITPALRLGAAAGLPHRWLMHVIRPGIAPLRSLALAINAPPDWPAHTFDLVDHAQKELQDGESLLLVIDQFEELFQFRRETLTTDAGDSASVFANLLINSVDQREVPIYVVLTMRTDFLGDCAQFRGLPEALNDCYYLVPRMTRLQQQEAIERPLNQWDTKIHAALVQRLLNDSADDPDHLPVLQHVLKRSWENWDERGAIGPIGISDYEAVGTWTDAIDHDAEAVCKRFSGHEQEIRLLFQWITELGAAERPWRRARPYAECLRITGLPAPIFDEIVSSFRDRGLLQAFDGTSDLIDLPHESVAWQWARLRQWIAAEAERASQLRFLLQAARQQMLLTGLALDSGLAFRSASRERLFTVERYLEPQEILQTQAWIGRSEEFALKQQSLAEARELAAWAALSLSDDPERSLILGLYSWAKEQSMVAGLEEFLHVALLRSPARINLSHDSSVWCVTWSPDGTKLATACADACVRVWNSMTSENVLTLTGHEGRVLSVAWSPDGTKLATGGYDAALIVWEAATGRRLMVTKAHQYAILSVAWSPDSCKLATGSDDNTAIVWRAANGAVVRKLPPFAHGVWRAAWSPDGKFLATASGDSVEVWQEERILCRLLGHRANVRSLVWSPDGRRLATASFDKTVKVWNASTGEELGTLAYHQDQALDLAWSPDGALLAIASLEGVAKVWDFNTGSEWRSILGHQAPILSVAWSPEGRRLATASDDGTVRVAELAAGCELLAIRDPDRRAPLWCASWSPAGNKVASGGDLPIANVWDAQTGNILLAIDSGGMYVESVVWSPDGKALAISSDTAVTIWDAESGAGMFTLRGHEGYVGRIAWSPDGTRIATASRDKSVKLWDVGNGSEILTIRGHAMDVRSVSWSPDATKLATASDDHSAKIWEAATGRELLDLRSENYPVAAVCWSPDGTKLAVASHDKLVCIWDAQSGEVTTVLRGHQATVLDVAWSPDGRRLATASWDSTARVWDATTGQEQVKLLGHRLFVRSVAWSPDGKRLACSGADTPADGSIQIYAIDKTLLLRLVRSRITRQLTASECLRFLGNSECATLPDVP